MRCLVRAEADALVATPDLGVEGVIRPCADAAVAKARAAVGRHLVGGGEASRERLGPQRERRGARWRGGEATRS
jgi:hypothetical protein